MVTSYKVNSTFVADGDNDASSVVDVANDDLRETRQYPHYYCH